MPETWRSRLVRLLDRGLWLPTLATPSSYLLVLAIIGTLAVKLSAWSALHDRSDALSVLTVMAPDAALLGGLGLLLFTAERVARARQLRLLKWTARGLAVAISIFALLNGAYLAVTGEQLTAGVVAMGWERFRDASGILLEELRQHALALGASTLVALAVPLQARRALRASSLGETSRRAFAPLLALALSGALAWALVPAPSSLPVARLARSALLTTYVTWIQSTLRVLADDSSSPWIAAPLVVPGSRQDDAGRLNVVMLVAESLRYDFTSLVPHPQAKTPHLAALADRGAWSDSASTPMPHTTKALFAVHCGQMPFWQSQTPEVSELVHAECLGHVLSREGYATAFFQSAVGAFEERPRLVSRLGFSRFEGWENIGGEPLGYLASDDLSLAPAFDAFLDGLPDGQLFLATLLTSATHHPYRLPNGEVERLRAAGTDVDGLEAKDRYRLLVERTDALLGKLIQIIERRGLDQRTIVVVLGDHGEGFGDKGVRQHDTNIYQESLRVPLVFAGPGVPRQQLAEDVSLLDVAPTVLNLLGFDTVQRDQTVYGRNALGTHTGPRTEYFACYYDNACYGYQRGQDKVVIMPELSRGVRFDLASDPLENRMLPPPHESPELTRLWQLMRELRMPDTVPESSDLRLSNGWSCTHRDGCRHPKTPPSMFFTVALPNDCVKAKRDSIPKQGQYEHVASLHNTCSGTVLCQLKVDAKGASDAVRLKPDESRDVVLARSAQPSEPTLQMTCNFL